MLWVAGGSPLPPALSDNPDRTPEITGIVFNATMHAHTKEFWFKDLNLGSISAFLSILLEKRLFIRGVRAHFSNSGW